MSTRIDRCFDVNVGDGNELPNFTPNVSDTLKKKKFFPREPTFEAFFQADLLGIPDGCGYDSRSERDFK